MQSWCGTGSRTPSRARKIPERDSEIVGVLLQRVVSELQVDLGEGPTDVVAVLAYETFGGNTGLTLFDVGSPRKIVLGYPTFFPYAGFVTTVVPGQGFGADLDLHGRYAYVASGNAGLQVVDLVRARELFLAEDPDPLSTIPSSIQKSWGVRGSRERGGGGGRPSGGVGAAGGLKASALDVVPILQPTDYPVTGLKSLSSDQVVTFLSAWRRRSISTTLARSSFTAPRSALSS